MLPVLLAALAAAPAPPAEPPTPAEQAKRDALTRFGVGVLRARDDRPADAVKQFEAAAKADPAAVAALRELVPLYADLGRDAAAIRTAEAVLRLDPADADTAHTLGQLLSEAKRPTDAARVLKQAADSPRLADRPAKRLAVLRDLAATSDPAGAEDALRAAVELISSQREALIQSGKFASFADLDREAGVVREKLGRALEAQKKYAAAEEAYRAAAALFAGKAAVPQAAARLGWNLSGVAAGRGDYPAALGYLQQFLALKPDGPEPYERLADLLTRAGRGAAVVPALAKLAAESPTVPAVRWVHAVEVGRTTPTRADQLFRELAQDTTDPAFYILVVKSYREANRPGELLALIDEWYKAARVAQDDAPPPPGKAADPKAVARARELTTAVRADRGAGRQLVEALADGGPLASAFGDDTWELLAALADRAGRPDLAEQAARRAWEATNPAFRGKGVVVDLSAFRRLYGLLTRQRKWREALEACDRTAGASAFFRIVPLAELAEYGRALEIADAVIASANGGPFLGRLQKARVFLIQGDYRRAAAECREAVKDAPSPADARQAKSLLSDALGGLRDYAGAEAELRALLDDDPDDAQALNNLGYTMADQGRNLDEAEELIRRAIRTDRDARSRAGNPEGESGVYLDSLGWVQFRRGRLADARATLEAAVRLPDSGADAVVWDHLGDVAFRQADPGRAKAAWARAVELYENSHQGRQAGRQAEARRKLRLVP